MLLYNIRKFGFTIVGVLLMLGCSKQAKDASQAVEYLKSAPSWTLEQITVNDVVTFQDGKVHAQFGGIEFNRYMERVSFEENGKFTGYFVNDPKPFTLKWSMLPDQILVGESTDQNSDRSWSIKPQDVNPTLFTMKIKSTAYDYPNLTQINLKFSATQK
jgi:hypothetical protein